VNTIAAEKEKRWPGGGLLLQQPPVGFWLFVLDGRLQRAAFQPPRAERGLVGVQEVVARRAACSATSR